MNQCKKQAIINAKKTDADLLKLKKHIIHAESELRKASWTVYSLHRFTRTITYNVSPFDLLDENAEADNGLLVKKIDTYWSGSVSYNYSMYHQRERPWQFSIFPTFRLSGQLDFSPQKKITVTQAKTIN